VVSKTVEIELIEYFRHLVFIIVHELVDTKMVVVIVLLIDIETLLTY